MNIRNTTYIKGTSKNPRTEEKVKKKTLIPTPTDIIVVIIKKTNNSTPANFNKNLFVKFKTLFKENFSFLIAKAIIA
ncbi:MAG: hypothetical protein ACP5H9_02420 [Candidatus Woesearchaeota archaeon]